MGGGGPGAGAAGPSSTRAPDGRGAFVMARLAVLSVAAFAIVMMASVTAIVGVVTRARGAEGAGPLRLRMNPHLPPDVKANAAGAGFIGGSAREHFHRRGEAVQVDPIRMFPCVESDCFFVNSLKVQCFQSIGFKSNELAPRHPCTEACSMSSQVSLSGQASAACRLCYGRDGRTPPLE